MVAPIVMIVNMAVHACSFKADKRPCFSKCNSGSSRQSIQGCLSNSNMRMHHHKTDKHKTTPPHGVNLVKTQSSTRRNDGKSVPSFQQINQTSVNYANLPLLAIHTCRQFNSHGGALPSGPMSFVVVPPWVLNLLAINAEVRILSSQMRIQTAF